MIEVGEVISYYDMCGEEGVTLQRGMNFRMGSSYSVILMSVHPNAPYADRVEEGGKILIYEGHDVPNKKGGPDPKTVDQERFNSSGTLTQNGQFYQAVEKYGKGGKPEKVKVYEKIRSGIWTFNGFFNLIDGWVEVVNQRKVFKFRLELTELDRDNDSKKLIQLDHPRLIPSHIKREVWKRDNGCCVNCGSKDNLHFDHIIPYSKGGSSLVAENIQLLCARHNLEKRDKIE